MNARYLTLNITPDLAGLEINTLLRRTLGLSGTVLRRVKWLPDGITLDGVRVNVRVRVLEGQVLSVRLTEAERKSGLVPRQGQLDILFEDRDLIVLNKTAGICVHPGPGHYDDTLGNFLLWHYDEEEEPADFHPVHRLDKGTTGLIVIAKHPHAQEKLKNSLHTGDFRRHYLAICDGVPAPAAGVIDAPLGPEDGSLIRRRVRPDGQPCRTRYKVLAQRSGRALLELELDTGRTHQIRVHMASIGCPLTGDFLYGTENRALISRPALHSAYLELTHPVSGERLAFSSPLPADMAALIPEEVFYENVASRQSCCTLPFNRPVDGGPDLFHPAGPGGSDQRPCHAGRDGAAGVCQCAAEDEGTVKKQRETPEDSGGWELLPCKKSSAALTDHAVRPIILSDTTRERKDHHGQI